ncbi:hypothetical protein D3C85_1214360 [compost metagenome]
MSNQAKAAAFTINGQQITLKLSQKAKDMGIEKIAIKGVRWFQKTYGNTYHVSYISALIDGKWIELGRTKMQYGYGDHYLVTAGEWLIENGFIEHNSESDSQAAYGIAYRTVREILDIEETSEDVKRKKDM